MISIGKNQNYVRIFPNPGFTFKLWPKRWFHYCRACGITLLKPGEARRGTGRKTFPTRGK